MHYMGLFEFPSQMLDFLGTLGLIKVILATLLKDREVCNHLPECKGARVVVSPGDSREGFCGHGPGAKRKSFSASAIALFSPVLHQSHGLNKTILLLCLIHQIKERDLLFLY